MDNKEFIDTLKELTGDLKVLFVEDENTTLVKISNRLRSVFMEVYTAENGIEGLRKYNENKPDLILTDNLMPGMDGLELIKEIRKTDIKTPIILITGYIDTGILIESINLGVTQFIAKPITNDNLLKAIEIAVQRTVIENLRQKSIEQERKSHEQELELLRYQERYHSYQQERAFRKELNIIRNDLYLREISPDGKDFKWLLDVYYKPLDIMCGDSYSVRDTGDETFLVFLFDSMGKGLSSSVTSILSTSFANYYIEEKYAENTFNLEDFIDSCTAFIRRELLDDEIMCATFAHIDLRNSFLDAALFSMPPIIGVTHDNAVVRFKSNNLPLMKFRQPCRIDRYDIAHLKKLLIHTDGLNESYKSDDILYQDFLEHDFRKSFGRNDLVASFFDKIRKPDDDVTFIYLKRLISSPQWTRTYTLSSKSSEFDAITEEIGMFLATLDADDDFAAMFINAFTEVLMNAYEHGNLNISKQLKDTLLRQGKLEEFLVEKESGCTKQINIKISCYKEPGREYLTATVCDEGEGFDLQILREPVAEASCYNGRGIRIAQSVVDEMYYNREGNEVTIIKRIPAKSMDSN